MIFFYFTKFYLLIIAKKKFQKNEPPKPKTNKKQRKKAKQKESENFKSSYIEFVQEVVGQDIYMPNLFYDPVESTEKHTGDNDANNADAEKRKKLFNQTLPTRRRLPKSLTINVNYVYGNGLNTSSTSPSLSALPTVSYSIDASTNNLDTTTPTTTVNAEELHQNLIDPTRRTESSTTNQNTSTNSLNESTINATTVLTAENGLCTSLTNNDCSVISYNFDWKTKTLQPTFATTQDSQTTPIQQHSAVINKEIRKYKYIKKIGKSYKLHKTIKQKSTAYREKRQLKRRCEDLITSYSLYLDQIVLKYEEHTLVQHYYRHFKALELYTSLLKGLKAICAKVSNNMSNSSQNIASHLKRARNSSNTTDDDNSTASARQVRKLNRQEENFRHMILPESPEETNRKDAGKKFRKLIHNFRLIYLQSFVFQYMLSISMKKLRKHLKLPIN